MQRRWFSGAELIERFDLSPLEWNKAIRSQLAPYTQAGQKIGFKDSCEYRGTPEQRNLIKLQRKLEELENGAKVIALAGLDAGKDVTADRISYLKNQITKLEQQGITPPKFPNRDVAWINLPSPEKRDFLGTLRRFAFKAEDVAAFAAQAGLPSIVSSPTQAKPPMEPDNQEFMNTLRDVIASVKADTSTETHKEENEDVPESVPPQSKSVERPDPAWVFRKNGDYWEIRVDGGITLHIKNTKGMKYICDLLQSPHKEFTGLDLKGEVEARHIALPTGGEEALDEKAKQEIWADIQALEDKIKQAQKADDEEGERSANNKLRALERTLSEEYGINRRQELFNKNADRVLKQRDPFELARKRVSKAITIAIKNIERPSNQFFMSYIKTGNRFSYVPPLDQPEWKF